MDGVSNPMIGGQYYRTPSIPQVSYIPTVPIQRSYIGSYYAPEISVPAIPSDSIVGTVNIPINQVSSNSVSRYNNAFGTIYSNVRTPYDASGSLFSQSNISQPPPLATDSIGNVRIPSTPFIATLDTNDDNSQSYNPSIAVDPTFGGRAPIAIDPPFGGRAPIAIDPPFGVRPPIAIDPLFEGRAPIAIDPPIVIDPLVAPKPSRSQAPSYYYSPIVQRSPFALNNLPTMTTSQVPAQYSCYNNPRIIGNNNVQNVFSLNAQRQTTISDQINSQSSSPVTTLQSFSQSLNIVIFFVLQRDIHFHHSNIRIIQ
ncbi:unnamed protein product [Rotaria magnacalcarata]|uniref:Uncharacterized protein n=1 Tax=Rotaria magnacalcarata TaxID=392030 RepID=A0A816ZCK3_9BILA|nr:unnamed protein product [Rotaria magnacalcarata]